MASQKQETQYTEEWLLNLIEEGHKLVSSFSSSSVTDKDCDYFLEKLRTVLTEGYWVYSYPSTPVTSQERKELENLLNADRKTVKQCIAANRAYLSSLSG
jgi:hypothetical protein